MTRAVPVGIGQNIVDGELTRPPHPPWVSSIVRYKFNPSLWMYTPVTVTESSKCWRQSLTRTTTRGRKQKKKKKVPNATKRARTLSHRNGRWGGGGGRFAVFRIAVSRFIVFRFAVLPYTHYTSYTQQLESNAKQWTLNGGTKKLRLAWSFVHPQTNRAFRFLRANLQKSTVKRLNTKAQHGSQVKQSRQRRVIRRIGTNDTANRHNTRVFKPTRTPVGSFKDTAKRETAKRYPTSTPPWWLLATPGISATTGQKGRVNVVQC